MIGRAPGKLILVGEHVVRYGAWALAFAVDRGTVVELERVDGPTHAAADPDDPLLREAVRAALPPTGWRVTVQSTLPIGRGMGSSASLAVALVRAQAAADGRVDDREAEYEAAMVLERVFHGRPSGLDVCVAQRGGLLQFRMGAPPTVVQLAPGPWQVVVIDTGVIGSTAALVASVADRAAGLSVPLDALARLADEAIVHHRDPAALGEVLSAAQVHLDALGVGHPAVDDAIAVARSAGALGAKLSGAGGGGVVLALVPTGGAEPVLAAAFRRGLSAFVTQPTEAS